MSDEKFNQAKYIQGFIKQKYDRIAFLVPKGKREIIQKCAKQQGMSANQLIVSALEAEYNIDLSKPQE